MKKRISCILLIISFIICLLPGSIIGARAEIIGPLVMLETPTNLEWVGGSTKWKTVQGVMAYELSLYKNGELMWSLGYDASHIDYLESWGMPYVDLSNQFDGSGAYTFTVKAWDIRNGYLVVSEVSAKSEPLIYTHPGVSFNTPTNLSWDSVDYYTLSTSI